MSNVFLLAVIVCSAVLLGSMLSKDTLVASQITHVKVSEVRNTGNRVRNEIQKQIDITS
jgi:hypothetical protein